MSGEPFTRAGAAMERLAIKAGRIALARAETLARAGEGGSVPPAAHDH